MEEDRDRVGWVERSDTHHSSAPIMLSSFSTA
jgi:hypothetical protein